MVKNMRLDNVKNVRCNITHKFADIMDYRCSVNKRIETLEGNRVESTKILTHRMIFSDNVIDYQLSDNKQLDIQLKEGTICRLEDYYKSKSTEHGVIYVDTLVCVGRYE